MCNGQLRFSDLTRRWQDLVTKMQQLNFGSLENLRIVNSEPEFHEDFKTITCFRFPGDNKPRPESKLEDFDLPAELCDFIQTFQRMGMATLRKVQVRHGLPFTAEWEDFE